MPRGIPNGPRQLWQCPKCARTYTSHVPISAVTCPTNTKHGRFGTFEMKLVWDRETDDTPMPAVNA